jgi:uncharacterized membrane protein
MSSLIPYTKILICLRVQCQSPFWQQQVFKFRMSVKGKHHLLLHVETLLKQRDTSLKLAMFIMAPVLHGIIMQEDVKRLVNPLHETKFVVFAAAS